MSLAAPWSLLTALAGLVPVAAILTVRRRQRRAAAALGLAPLPRGRVALEAGLAAVAVAALAVCAAAPMAWRHELARERGDAEAYVLVDTSRSMLARSTLDAPDRLEQARAAALRLASLLPVDLPVGLAGFNDQPLPLLAPTIDRDSFREVLPYATTSLPTSPLILASGLSTGTTATQQASNYAGLLVAALGNFFAPADTHRLFFLLTDGDTSAYDAQKVGSLLRARGITLVAVRVGSAGDRLWYRDREGAVRVDHAYVFERAHTDLLRTTAEATGGAALSGTDAIEQAAGLAVHKLGDPQRGTRTTSTIRMTPRDLSLVAALVAFAALLPLGALLGLGILLPPARGVRSRPRPRET